MNKKNKNSKKLFLLIYLFPFITMLLYGILSYGFLLYSNSNNIYKELVDYENVLMSSENKSLKNEVFNLTNYIEYYDKKNTKELKKHIINIVEISSKIANNIFLKNKKKFGSKIIKNMIIDALSGIKFNNDLDYLFILNLNDDVISHPDNKMINTNVRDIQDINGKFIMNEFHKVLREGNKGFVNYYWHMPNSNNNDIFYKNTYIKMLDCYNWYIGAGTYSEYIKQFIKKDILNYIKNNLSNTESFYFITDSKNKIIMNQTNDNIDDILKYRLEGEYADNKYISYTSYIPRYDWYITRVKEVKVIKKIIENKKITKKLEIENNNINTIYILLFLWTISLLFSIYLSRIIKNLFIKHKKEINDTNKKLIFQSRQALLGELLPMIAHQWRQPINKIASIVVNLRFNYEDKNVDIKTIDNKYEEIEKNIEFMSETIDTFNEFYLPKENKFNESINKLIIQAVDFLEGFIKKKNIEISLNLEEIHFELFTNEFLQVIINIIKNSIDASLINGKININLFRNKKDIFIEVIDYGTGIDKKNKDKIFEPYITTKKDSLGLGLYMSNIIIEKHLGGKINFISKQGKTKFTIHLES